LLFPLDGLFLSLIWSDLPCRFWLILVRYKYLTVLEIHLLGKSFFHPFTLSQCLFFSVRSIFCKQQMGGSCFLIQFASLCLLIGALRPLTFSVIIESCVVFPVIFTPLSLLFLDSLFASVLGQRDLFFFTFSWLTLISS
jgi:hypothetical protein